MAPWPSAFRDAIIAFISQARTAGEVALHHALPPRETRAYLRWMARHGDIKRIAFDVYAPRDYAGSMPERRAIMRPRPGTQREAIIRFVSQPRAIGEIEAQVGRPGQNVASHLREMARLGYIKRVGPGIYAPRDYAGPMPEHWAIKPPRPGTQREAILRFVSQPRAIREVAEHLGYPAGTIKAQLTMLTRIGFLKRVGPGIYAPRDYAGPAASVARSKKKCKP